MLFLVAVAVHYDVSQFFYDVSSRHDVNMLKNLSITSLRSPSCSISSGFFSSALFLSLIWFQSCRTKPYSMACQKTNTKMYSHWPQSNLTSSRPNQPFRVMAYSHWPEPRPGQDRKQMGCLKLCGYFHITPASGQRPRPIVPIVLVLVSVPILVLVPLSENTPWVSNAALSHSHK